MRKKIVRANLRTKAVEYPGNPPDAYNQGFRKGELDSERGAGIVTGV